VALPVDADGFAPWLRTGRIRKGAERTGEWVTVRAALLLLPLSGVCVCLCADLPLSSCRVTVVGVLFTCVDAWQGGCALRCLDG